MARSKAAANPDPLGDVVSGTIGLVEGGLVDEHLSDLLAAAQARFNSDGYIDFRHRQNGAVRS